MTTIQVLDKKFVPFLTEEEIRAAVRRIAEDLERKLEGERPFFVCVLRGALYFFADLLEEIRIPYNFSLYQVSSYEGLQSTQNLREITPFLRDVHGRTVVLVEDILETGHTLSVLKEKFYERGAKRVMITTLLLKPDVFQERFPVECVGLSIPDDFVIGYGLDYNQEGRELREIYRLSEE
ncbi:MAG: phosphoribosyltransferase family protein [Planctomycetia bacterium]|nr:phosphoribosyltransferase family protein [Planctomycetia bacterium]